MRSAQRPGLGHLIASALMVLGIALMHHVVVTGCSALGASPDHSHAAAEVADMTASPATDAGSAGSSGAPSAALCLAVLLGAWLAAPIVRAWRARRSDTIHERTEASRVVGVLAHPPDLAELSVRRT